MQTFARAQSQIMQTPTYSQPHCVSGQKPPNRHWHWHSHSHAHTRVQRFVGYVAMLFCALILSRIGPNKLAPSPHEGEEGMPRQTLTTTTTTLFRSASHSMRMWFLSHCCSCWRISAGMRALALAHTHAHNSRGARSSPARAISILDDCVWPAAFGPAI